MFEGWDDFFLMAGGAAAVLIGLIFVVISLMGDRPRSTVLAGSKLYMGPIVLGVSFVLALSAAALTPAISRSAFSALTAAIALWGLARGLISTTGIGRLKEVHWTDVWFYGVYPCAIYLALGLVAIAFINDWWWAHFGLAAVITLSLLLAIRNEWDLITWITPKGEPGEDELR
ncbi:MAG TPA: hypothetical protein VHE36_03135 [Sphingomicrobium sp.]|jgi:hypothetical protein|nr:hypothetical protein [Sphingomicrobium sp.]